MIIPHPSSSSATVIVSTYRRNSAAPPRDEGVKLRIKQVTHGGWTLKQHAENDATLRAIREGDWDYVVIQEQSLIPSQPLKRTHAMFPNVRKLADEARKAGAVPVLYQTWGRRDGNEMAPRQRRLPCDEPPPARRLPAGGGATPVG